MAHGPFVSFKTSTGRGGEGEVYGLHKVEKTNKYPEGKEGASKKRKENEKEVCDLGYAAGVR